MMKIALYRAQAGNWLDTGINWFSGGGGFSHCELVFPDGASFSSTTRDQSVDSVGRFKKDGTRWAKDNFLGFRQKIDFDSHWSLVDLPATEAQIAAMMEYANMLLDARYDYWGVIRFIPGIGILAREHADAYFCSEAVVEVCHRGDLLNNFNAPMTSPNRLAKFFGVK